MVPAQTAGRYDLLEEIGRGGAAVVYLAYQRDLRRRVALKELLSQHLADPNFAERFVEESRLAGAMSHSSIVTVHEYFEHDGVPYIAMEHLARGSLRGYVGRLSVAQLAGMLESVLAGLSHGESHGIVHRDLKPENLLVAADGRVKIADFGVARAYNAAAPRAVVTVTGTTIGTPAYMAPEQALGEQLTPATDLYSLGIVAWEMLTGAVPFETTDTPVAVLYRHVHEPVPSVSDVDPEVDERLAAWLDRMLAKRPEDRFQNADSAWNALEDVIIDLNGPRWRREARLGTDSAEPDLRPLTPAQFETERARRADLAAAPATTGDATPSEATSVADEPPPVEGAPAPVPATVGRTTVLRPGRRHHAGEASVPATVEKPSRRRALIAALVVATAVAAGAGVLVGVSGGNSSTTTGGATTTRSTATRDHELTAALQTLATTRADELVRLRAARTVSQQVSAATAIATAYEAAAGRIAAIPGSPSALHATVDRLASLYRSLATAARQREAAHLGQVTAQIASAERQLGAQAEKL